MLLSYVSWFPPMSPPHQRTVGVCNRGLDHRKVVFHYSVIYTICILFSLHPSSRSRSGRWAACFRPPIRYNSYWCYRWGECLFQVMLRNSLDRERARKLSLTWRKRKLKWCWFSIQPIVIHFQTRNKAREKVWNINKISTYKVLMMLH